MNLQALRAFKRRDTREFVRVGEKFVAMEEYGKAAVRAGLAIDLDGKVKSEPAKAKVVALTRPVETKAVPAAPENRALPAAPENAAVPTSAGGAEQPSSASPPARRSRKTTASSSAAGARKRKTESGES